MPEPVDPSHPATVSSDQHPSVASDLDRTTTAVPRADGSAAPPFAPPAGPGEVGTLGPYRVLKPLGRGGMGAVYLALDTRLDRKLALKVMLPEFAADRAARERFLREARAAAKISHDNVVTVYEADERDGVPYIAMQFLQGYPLDQYLKAKGPPALPHVLRVARETALGLSAAHALGLVHRDIKPANLWLEAPNGRVKVLDFGLAKPMGADTELTRSGAVMGTPAYMSPEQARGQKVDACTDLFSLGAVLYRLCTGRTPFAGPTVMAVLMALGSDEPAPVRDLNPNVPEALAALVHQLLSKRPADRPQTAAAVSERLRTILEQLAAPAPAAELAVHPVHEQPPIIVSQMHITAPPPSAFADLGADDPGPAERANARPAAGRKKAGGKGGLIAAGVALLLAAGVGATILALTNKKPVPEARAPDGGPPGDRPGPQGPDAPARPEAWKPGPAWKPTPAGASPFDKLDPKEIPAAERFDWQPKELVAVIGAHERRMWWTGATVISPDDRYAVAGSNPPVVWDVATRTRKWAVPTDPSSQHQPIGFTPDGKRLFVGGRWGVTAFDMTDDGSKSWAVGAGGLPRPLVNYPGEYLWEAMEGGRTLVARYPRHQPGQTVTCFDVSGPEPRKGAGFEARWIVFATAADRVIYLTPAGKLRRATVKGAALEADEQLSIEPGEKAGFAAVSADGKRLAYREPDGAVLIWDVSRSPATRVHTLKPAQTEGYSTLAFSPDGRWLASKYGLTTLFRIDGSELPPPAVLDRTDSTGDGSVAFTRDGHRAVVVTGNGLVRFWDLSGPEPADLTPFDPATAFLPPYLWQDGLPLDSRRGRLTLRRFGGPFDYQVWNLTGARPAAAFTPAALPTVPWVRPVAGDRWIGGGNSFADGLPVQYYTATEKGWQAEGELLGACARIHTSPDGSLLLRVVRGGPADPIRAEGYDITGARPVLKWALESKEHPLGDAPVHVSGDNRWLAYYSRKVNGGPPVLAVWQNTGAKPVFYAAIPLGAGPRIANGHLYRVALSPDGRYLCHNKDELNELVIEDLTGREPREVAKIPADALNNCGLAFHPDGRKLAVGLFTGATVFEVPGGKPLWKWVAPGPVHWVGFADDGRHLFAHNANGTVYVLRPPDLGK